MAAGESFQATGAEVDGVSSHATLVENPVVSVVGASVSLGAGSDHGVTGGSSCAVLGGSSLAATGAASTGGLSFVAAAPPHLLVPSGRAFVEVIASTGASNEGGSGTRSSVDVRLD
jgi:hypothetical protein